MSYESPVKIIMQEAKTIFESDIVNAIQRYGIDVDKQELIRALNYDRLQYEAGYADAMRKIVRCKDCVYFRFMDDNFGDCECKRFAIPQISYPTMHIDDYCSYGERGETRNADDD